MRPEPIDPERVLKALKSMPPDQVVEPGVTAGDALAVMSIPDAPEGMTHIADQQYGTAGAGGRPLTMHLWKGQAGERRPGVVLIHGGGFQEGYPEMVTRYAGELAARGYVTCAIRYRVAGEAPFPACVEDAKAAVRWMRANADEIGLDVDRLGVAGNSAGGCLSALIANAPGHFEGDGGNDGVSSAVRAAVLLYPAVTFLPEQTSDLVQFLMRNVFWQEEVSLDDLRAASAITHLETAPPTLTFAGDIDPIIRLDSLEEYHRRLTDLGIPNELVVVSGAGHSFDYSLVRWQECFDRMATFFDIHLAPVAARAWSAQFALDTDEASTARESFEREGFCFSPPLVDVDLLDAVAERMDAVLAGDYETGVAPHRRFWDPADGDDVLRKVDDAHFSDSTIHRLVSSPSIGQWAAAVTGATFVQVWSTQLLVKPAGPGAGVGWHQDLPYWRRWFAGGVLTAWLAVTDVTERDGPVVYLAGSHRWGEVGGNFFDADVDGVQARLELPADAEWREVPAVLPAGACSFHAPLVVHGSRPNDGAAARRSFAIHLRTEHGVPLAGDDVHYVTDLDDHDRHPVLLDQR